VSVIAHTGAQSEDRAPEQNMETAMRAYLLATVCCSGLAAAQPSGVAFEDSVAVYGPGIFPALTQLHACGDFRVLVAVDTMGTKTKTSNSRCC
jgi:hypothetical protein